METKLIEDLTLYYAGRDAATADMDTPAFDVKAAIASFDCDPPDSPYQRGYLRGLVKG